MAKQKKRQPKDPPPVYDKRKMFYFFRASLANTLTDWEAFRNIFVHPARCAYATKHAPKLANSISTLLTVSAYMGIAQLFDPKDSFNDPSKPNLVLRRVIDDIAPAVGTPERTEIEDHFNAMMPTVLLIKDWRHRMGAHRSLTTSIQIVEYMESLYQNPHPMPRITIAAVTDVLQRLAKITDIITLAVDGRVLAWYTVDVVQEVETLFAKLSE